jgi:hypothetical protein
MSYNKAACDSKDANYASGRLDFMPYYDSLDIDRADCDMVVMDRTFNVWFDMAIGRYGWLGGNAESIGPAARVHVWDWPKHRVADVQAEADANRTKLESGQTFPHLVFTEAGLSFDDEVAKAAQAFGVTEQEVRSRLFDVLLPPQQRTEPPAMTPAGSAAASLVQRLEQRGLPKLNGNGAHHG